MKLLSILILLLLAVFSVADEACEQWCDQQIQHAIAAEKKTMTDVATEQHAHIEALKGEIEELKRSNALANEAQAKLQQANSDLEAHWSKEMASQKELLQKAQDAAKKSQEEVIAAQEKLEEAMRSSGIDIKGMWKDFVAFFKKLIGGDKKADEKEDL